MDNDERFEQEAQENYKREMERLSEAIEPEYTCNGCGETFYSTDERDYVECPECLSDDVSTEAEETREDYEQGVLAFDKVTTYQVTMSTGGPADGYILHVDDDGYITSAEYWFQDWFQPKRKFVLVGDNLDNVRSMFGGWTEADSNV